MDVNLSSWFIILLAAFAANIPFFNERLFGLVPSSFLVKPFWLRLLELGIFYGLVISLAYLLERQMGNVFSQGWEFYAITVCLFLVLAFPGFVFRYLRRRHG